MKIKIIGKMFFPDIVLEDGMIGEVTEEFDDFIVAEFDGIGIPFNHSDEGVFFHYVE
jgi:hypothetical protein